MKLISNWRKAWRMASVQVAAVAVVLGSLPSDVQAAMFGAVGVPVERIPALIGVLLLVARLVDQPKTRDVGNE